LKIALARSAVPWISLILDPRDSLRLSDSIHSTAAKSFGTPSIDTNSFMKILEISGTFDRTECRISVIISSLIAN
jgi:hypothetical protein